ncbi:MAG: hypothetical protein JRJ59_11970 [Deltaproteobacteria bacterium]|nr:hypothetical protein [Deltaproteobacteria bacterium]
MDTLPSVTQVLSPFADFSGVRPEVLDNAARRGRQVHAICSAIVQGLWVPEIPEDCAGYVESFRRWLPVVEKVIFCEKRLADEALGFKGKPDLGVVIKGDKMISIPDLKTPAVKSPLWKAQLAAYKHLVEHNGYGPVGRVFSLRLKKDGGRPILDEYFGSPQDFAAFLSALNAYRCFKAA